VLKGKFIVMSTYIRATAATTTKNRDRFQINNLMMYLKLLEKQE
jgi:hypothetical protein